jgi:2-dehydro-3-deoxygluconokinase
MEGLRMTYDLTTIGETMLRISTPPGTPLETAAAAQLHAAGSESNVAAALASLGHRVAWASVLPNTPPGRFIAGALRVAGVDLSHVKWTDAGRQASFYVELEQPPTPVRVTYDRADSVASQMSSDQIDWPRLLNTRLLHLTGITPALSTGCLALTQDAVRRAKQQGVPMSFDINYRRKLWSPAQARDVLTPLIHDIDLLFIGESDAAEVFTLSGPPEEKLADLANLTRAKKIVLTIGEQGTISYDAGTIRHQPAQPTAIIDRLGAGDALAAGVIHGWLGGDFVMGLKAGAALAALALRRHGDIVICPPAELMTLMNASSDRPNR